MTKEMFEKAKTAKSAEELLEMAKAEGYEMTEEKAKEIFERLNSDAELSDEELGAVAGGVFPISTQDDWWRYDRYAKFRDEDGYFKTYGYKNGDKISIGHCLHGCGSTEGRVRIEGISKIVMPAVDCAKCGCTLGALCDFV